MEEDMRAFFIRILQSIAVILLWMLVNIFIGIYKELAFFTGMPGWKNWLFYGFFLASGIFVARHLYKKWKGVAMPRQ